MNHYRIRYSKRAKRLQMRIDYRGLEVIVPHNRRYPTSIIQQFIQEKEPWVKAHLPPHFFHEDPITTALPSEINLKAIQQIWRLRHVPTSISMVKLIANLNHEISLIGNISNPKACVQQIKRWLKGLANFHFHHRMQQLAHQTGLHFNGLSVRWNTNRWGSCSEKKHIVLCCRLLFLAPELADHVMLHELCHTNLLNHSKAFWQLLQQHDHNMRVHKKALALASQSLPAWLYHDLNA